MTLLLRAIKKKKGPGKALGAAGVREGGRPASLYKNRCRKACFVRIFGRSGIFKMPGG